MRYNHCLSIWCRKRLLPVSPGHCIGVVPHVQSDGRPCRGDHDSRHDSYTHAEREENLLTMELD